MMIADNTTDAKEQSSAFVTFDCPEPHCIMQFRREDRLNAHLLLGVHKTLASSVRLVDKAILIYRDGFTRDDHKQVPVLPASITTGSSSTDINDKLMEGWALFRPRARVPFSIAQRSYLDEKYNDGEKSGGKWNADSVAEV